MEIIHPLRKGCKSAIDSVQLRPGLEAWHHLKVVQISILLNFYLTASPLQFMNHFINCRGLVSAQLPFSACELGEFYGTKSEP